LTPAFPRGALTLCPQLCMGISPRRYTEIGLLPPCPVQLVRLRQLDVLLTQLAKKPAVHLTEGSLRISKRTEIGSRGAWNLQGNAHTDGEWGGDPPQLVPNRLVSVISSCAERRRFARNSVWAFSQAPAFLRRLLTFCPQLCMGLSPRRFTEIGLLPPLPWGAGC
jgi:hypothetical protein